MGLMALRWVHTEEPVDPQFVEFVVESFPELDPAVVREDLNRPWIEVDEPDDIVSPVLVTEGFELEELAYGERREWATHIVPADEMDQDADEFGEEGWEL